MNRIIYVTAIVDNTTYDKVSKFVTRLRCEFIQAMRLDRLLADIKYNFREEVRRSFYS